LIYATAVKRDHGVPPHRFRYWYVGCTFNFQSLQMKELDNSTI
jgi:hypothetical protein